MLTMNQVKGYFTHRYYIGIALVLGIVFSLAVDLGFIPVSIALNPLVSLVMMVATWVASLFFIDLLAPATGVTSDGSYRSKYMAISQLMGCSQKMLKRALIISLIIGVLAYYIQGVYVLLPFTQVVHFILNSLFIGMLGIVITSVVVLFKRQ